MHPKLLKSRYRLFQYRNVEREIAAESSRILDIGCGDGENLLRFDPFARKREGAKLNRFGMEVSWARLLTARKAGLDVTQADGAVLPYKNGTFDMVYVAHVLHHVDDYGRVIEEMKRVAADGGTIFVVETVTDHPILRWARRINPYWQGDHVENDWSFTELKEIFETNGLKIVENGRYNLIFWLWEMFPLTFWPLEIFTPIFVELDLLLARFWHQYSVHAYFVLRRSD